MKALKETMLSLVGGAGLLVFMGGLIGGISLLLYQVVHFLRQGEWLAIPAASALERIGMEPASVQGTTVSGGLVGWVLNQPLAALAILIAIVIGWPLIVLSDRLMTRRKS
ncbi:MAG: hypothetical protein LC667_13065 [Thioalkalivibrio sp.]|nr:hypothetical protein [Thioalkalivibrio sp.]